MKRHETPPAARCPAPPLPASHSTRKPRPAVVDEANVAEWMNEAAAEAAAADRGPIPGPAPIPSPPAVIPPPVAVPQVVQPEPAPYYQPAAPVLVQVRREAPRPQRSAVGAGFGAAFGVFLFLVVLFVGLPLLLTFGAGFFAVGFAAVGPAFVPLVVVSLLLVWALIVCFR